MLPLFAGEWCFTLFGERSLSRFYLKFTFAIFLTRLSKYNIYIK